MPWLPQGDAKRSARLCRSQRLFQRLRMIGFNLKGSPCHHALSANLTHSQYYQLCDAARDNALPIRSLIHRILQQMLGMSRFGAPAPTRRPDRRSIQGELPCVKEWCLCAWTGLVWCAQVARPQRSQ